MKKLTFVLTLFTLGLFSCSKTNQPGGLKERNSTVVNDGYSETTSDQRNTAASSLDNQNQNLTLDFYLKQISGVNVQGSGASARVTVRGVNSLGSGVSSDAPLFIVDGVPAGGGYSQVYEMITPQEIKRVTVLKDGGATSIYGTRGANGVILITTKNKKD